MFYLYTKKYIKLPVSAQAHGNSYIFYKKTNSYEFEQMTYT